MPEVAIVGAGFAGLTLALFLHNHGINSEIYELRDPSHTNGGSITLAPNAVRVLSHLGLYSTIYAQGYSHDVMTILNPSGQILAKSPPIGQKAYNFAALRIARTTLIDILRNELKRRGIPIHYNRHCTEIIHEDPRSVKIGFADGGIVTASFIVGADGMRSCLRAHIAPETSGSGPIYAGQTQITGWISKDDIKDVETKFSLPAIFFCQNGTFGIMPYTFDGDKFGFGVTLSLEDRSREEWNKFSEDKEAIHELLLQQYSEGEDNKHNHQLIKTILKTTNVDDLMVWQYSSSPDIAQWYSKYQHCRVFVLGDAAHGTPPSGQGAGMALEDAETLAWMLFEVSKPRPFEAEVEEEEDGARLRRLAKAWDAHRRDRVTKVLGLASGPGLLRGAASGWLQQKAKEWAIWIGGYLIGKLKDNSLVYGYDGGSVRTVMVMTQHC